MWTRIDLPLRIRIPVCLESWIRIRIENSDADPDPGELKFATITEKFQKKFLKDLRHYLYWAATFDLTLRVL
jgi:hypothetical protein